MQREGLVTPHSDADNRPLLLIGNSINLVAKCHKNISYRNVLKKIIKGYDMKAAPHSSISELHRLIADYEETHPNTEPFEKLMEQLQGLRPTQAHHLLATLSSRFYKILTLNFDYAIEKALHISPCHTGEDPVKIIPLIKRGQTVCHIHGSIGSPKKKGSCILSPKAYDTALRLFPESLPENFSEEPGADECPWWQDFITKEVHICGASLGEDEIILYHVLELRMEWIKKQPNRATPWTNRIYAYLFETPKDRKSGAVKRVASKLLSLRVHPIIIPVRDVSADVSSFNSAWEILICKLILHCNRICVFPDALQKLPLTKRATDRTRRYNVSLSTVPDLKYPDYYVFTPAMKMLNTALSQGIKQWLFYVIKDTKPLYWWVNLSELLTYAKNIELPEGMSFYLDSQSGRLLSLDTLLPSSFVCNPTKERHFNSCIHKIKNPRNTLAIH